MQKYWVVRMGVPLFCGSSVSMLKKGSIKDLAGKKTTVWANSDREGQKRGELALD